MQLRGRSKIAQRFWGKEYLGFYNDFRLKKPRYKGGGRKFAFRNF